MMADNMMERCETKRLYKLDGKKEWRWVEIAVAEVTEEREIRCVHCHGAIKVHKGRAAAAAEAHVKHRSRVDADNCQDGRGVQGACGLSSHPVD